MQNPSLNPTQLFHSYFVLIVLKADLICCFHQHLLFYCSVLSTQTIKKILEDTS